MNQECRLRIDPNLVHKFLRLPGGINEVGVKIVRDLGLRFSYDKQSHSLDIIGNNPDILGIAIETLRFWVEDDEFPRTGITCQIGYPNKCMVIWRYHGDFAKKLDHLFAEEIEQLKRIPTVVFKAVPTKRNPDYLEVYCHFTFYERVKEDISELSSQVSRICQDDFFVPFSDCTKAKRFVKSRVRDQTVLYALKENPELNRLRVWIFGRYQSNVIRAKRNWIQHVGDVTLEHDVQQSPRRDGSVKSAHFYGHLSPSNTHRTTSPSVSNQHTPRTTHMHSKSEYHPDTKVNKLASNSDKHKNKRFPITIPKADNNNFPRPSDFVYPINTVPVIEPMSEEDLQYLSNPFNNYDMDILENTIQTHHIEATQTVSKSGWEKATHGASKPRRNKGPPNRIYVHRQVNEHRNINGMTMEVVHPETNLMPSERYKTKQSERLFANTTRRRNNVKQGGLKPAGLLRQKPAAIRPQERAANVRFHINIHGLDIYMYKHNIVKLDDMDAIVIPVNENISGGGHLALTVFDMAGPQVTDEINVHRNIHGPLGVGESMVSSAGRLPFLGLIYVSAPVWENYIHASEEDCARDLHRAIYSAMKTAEKHKYRKIAMAVVGSEPYFGVPKDLVSEVHVKALVDYSMGMGPLFPVLEVHLVDTDIQMLTYIKDAYEKWTTDSSTANMAQHFKTDLPDQQELSERRQSAVTIKEFPSHHSENMVTFAGQSYTAEGNQMWTFDVLKRLMVHVYTGTLVKIRDVEAIVCGVSPNFKGTLAKLVLNIGGPSYEEALKRARRGRDMTECDVLVCEAGGVPVDIVLHAIVGTPIFKATEKNLARLDTLYSRVLQATHTLNIKSLGMPLIATGRLREKFEVEQCSLRMIDCIIELCLSQGPSLNLRELHLVNLDSVITQSLTQALRTRAHTKLRVESDPHPPSRPAMLSIPDSPVMTHMEPDKTPCSTGDTHDTDIVEEFKQLAEMQRRGENRNSKFQNIDEMNTLLNGKRKTKTMNIAQNEERPHNDTNGSNDEKLKTKGDQSQSDNKVKGRNETERGTSKVNKAQAPYLSKKVLQEHTKILSKPEGKTEELPKAADKVRLRKPHPMQQSTPQTQKSGTYNKSKDADQNGMPQKDEPKKKKRLPPVRGYVQQKSRAESYRSIYIRRQIIAEQLLKEKHVKIRRAKSATQLHKEPIKPMPTNALTAREGRHPHPYQPATVVIRSRPPHGTQLDEPEEKHKKKVIRKPAMFRDKDREDRYMKEMEMFLQAPYGQTEEHHPTDEPTDVQYVISRRGSSNAEYSNPNESYRSQGRGDDIAANHDIFSQHADNENRKPGNTSRRSSVHSLGPKQPSHVSQQHMDPSNEHGISLQLEQKDVDTRPTQHTNVIETSMEPSFDQQAHAIQNDQSDDVDTNDQINDQSFQSTENKSKPLKLIISSEVAESNINNEHTNKSSGITKTNKSQNKQNKVEVISFKNKPKPIPTDSNTSTENDVTIRDKLTLEIDVADREPTKLTREKEKIKRFWEVVGGKDLTDEKDLYGEENKANGEKILLTRVKKERKMSAKSKSSKQSDATNVTAKKLGKYNVTVEVA